MNVPTDGIEDDKPESVLIRIGLALRRSFFLSLTLSGVVLLFVGYVVFGQILVGKLWSVLAGMMGIWGLTAILIGGVSYTVIRFLRKS